MLRILQTSKNLLESFEELKMVWQACFLSGYTLKNPLPH